MFDSDSQLAEQGEMTMPPQVPKGVLDPLQPRQWSHLPPQTQTILALAVFVLAGAVALSGVLWVVLRLTSNN
jgi:hypothetical protein